MRAFFRQVYVQQGAEFPFSHIFQRYISAEVTSRVVPSPKFIAKYGEDFKLGFNVSAKHDLEDNEIRGPTVFRKTKDVEYSIFLPFTMIMRQPDPRRTALTYLFQGAYDVFHKLGIDSSNVQSHQEPVIRRILSDPEMYRVCPYDAGPGVGPPVWTATPMEGEISCPSQEPSPRRIKGDAAQS